VFPLCIELYQRDDAHADAAEGGEPEGGPYCPEAGSEIELIDIAS
jgi:hypothetical protein